MPWFIARNSNNTVVAVLAQLNTIALLQYYVVVNNLFSRALEISF